MATLKERVAVLEEKFAQMEGSPKNMSKKRGRNPSNKTESKARKPTQNTSEDAPYGLKKDGTPKKKPGRHKSKASRKMTTSRKTHKAHSDAPYGLKKDGTPKKKPGRKGSEKKQQKAHKGHFDFNAFMTEPPKRKPGRPRKKKQK